MLYNGPNHMFRMCNLIDTPKL